MNPISHRPAAHRALAMGLAAGSWLILSGFAPGIDVPLLSGAGPAASEPGRILLAQADPAPASTPVAYTTEQADRGKEVYSEDCVECHGKDMRGGLLGGPPLRGVAFETKYAKGGPAGVLYEVMMGTMPPNAPGSYSPSVYADLMAYILKTNGFKAGAELPADVDALYNMTIEK